MVTKTQTEKNSPSLKEIRDYLGYSLRYVGSATGLSPATIKNIESGKTDCGYKKYTKLCAFYKYHLAVLAKKKELNSYV